MSVARPLAALVLTAALAAAQDVAAPDAPGFAIPAHDGWVTDLAGLLSDEEEASLEDLMERYRQGSTHEIALLTVPDLQGRSIEEFALRTARDWGIGGAETTNGALLLASAGDKELRIEVGRGLEGTLTDSISGRIIRDVIVPRFEDGDFPGGLRAGIEAIHAAIGGDYAEIPPPSRPEPSPIALFVLLLLAVLFVIVIVRAGRRLHDAWPLGPSLGMPRGRWTLGPWGGGFGGGGGGFGSGGGFGGGGFGGFSGGHGFSGGGASGGWR